MVGIVFKPWLPERSHITSCHNIHCFLCQPKIDLAVFCTKLSDLVQLGAQISFFLELPIKDSMTHDPWQNREDLFWKIEEV